MSANATPVPPFEFSQAGTFDAPYVYEVPASGEVQPYSATATWDGTGAAGAFQPTISIYSANGNLLARVFPEGVTMQPGDVAEVTFIPPFGSAASSGGSGSGITEITSVDNTVTVTDPTGPITDLSVAGGGTILVEQLIGTNLTVAHNGQGTISWAHAGGATLTDLTTPTDPTLLSAGIYSLFLQLSVDPAPTPASIYARVGVGSPFQFLSDTVVIEGGATSGPGGQAPVYVGDLPNGQDCTVQINNDDPTNAHTFSSFMRIVKFA